MTNDNAPHDVSSHFISINFNLFHLCNKIVKAWHACLCVGVSPLMPRSQARCPWDEWAPEKCKKMPRKHKKAVLQRLVIRYKYCFFVLFPVLRWALHWLPWRSVRDLWAWRWGRVGKIIWHLCLLCCYYFCLSWECQKLKSIRLTPTSKLSHASPKGPECRLCPALLFEGLFSRCDLSSVNGHSEVAVRSFSKSCESSVPRCQEEHVIRTQSRGKTLVPPSGLTTQEGKLFVRWFTPCCYTEGSKPIQTSLKSKSFEVPKVRHLKVISF